MMILTLHTDDDEVLAELSKLRQLLHAKSHPSPPKQ